MQKLKPEEDNLHGQGHTAYKGQNWNTVLSDFKVYMLSIFANQWMNTTFGLRGCDPKWTLDVRMTDPWILYFLYLNILVSRFHSTLSYHLHHCVKEIWELFLLEMQRERAWGPGETGGRTSSGVLTLAQTGSWGLMVNICQLCIQWYYTGSLKLASVGECIPQKLANSISQRLFPPIWNPVVKYLPAQHCLWPKNSSYLLPTYLTYNAETGME